MPIDRPSAFRKALQKAMPLVEAGRIKLEEAREIMTPALGNMPEPRAHAPAEWKRMMDATRCAFEAVGKAIEACKEWEEKSRSHG
jgi:hypothetical protein